ncbi:hypothetical protein SAMN06297358_0869 [Pedobacter xixiisoli]|uniref:Uncharacterized protein n=2 Tax=Pedobacter xixiisoli TaxID=1476464 RepID=A0A285ZT68_9SPHI|nr:hypothetical protein SAMN06297358_0869 [Pedobacter xixiisoli]
MNTDLQRFIEKFQPNKFKLMAQGVEIRGAVDLHNAMKEARMLIERFQLSLTVNHNAEMLSYQGFEVNLLSVKDVEAA